MEHMKNSTLFETDYWIVILSDNQSIFGRCVIDIKRDVGSLRDLTPDEWKDLQENVIKPLEKTIRKAFGAELFNWMCLMNNAFKPHIEKPQPHVHFHCLPRYRNPVEIMGEICEDNQFGHYYARDDKKRVSQEVFDAIKKRILEGI